MASIDKVQVEIEATAKGTSAVFAQLQTQLATLKSAMDSIDTSKLQKITKGSNKVNVDASGMTDAEKKISSEIDKIEQNLARLKSLKEAALSGDSSSATSFSRRVISLQGDIDALGERLKQLNDNRIGINIDSDAFQTYRERLAEVQSSLNTAKTSVSEAVATMNAQKVNPDTKEASSNLSDIAAKAKEAASSLWSMTKSGLKTGFNGLKTALSSIKNTLTSIGSNASKSVSNGFTKILKYGFGIRSLYVLFRRLKTAIKDSFTELQNSGAQYQTTRANIEALKSSLTTLKYQFGAAFEPIFNTVAPALQTLINYLVTVMNTISAFIAKLTGKSTYSKAVASTAAIAANTGSAAGSAAELNKQLQGFDELNNLDLDSGSGGGSGGGGSSDSGTVQYVEESVESALGDFANSLIDKIKAGDWEGVGSAISEKITNALNGINWDVIKSKASNFGTNLASFFNGFINTDLFSSLGTTLAEAINTAFTALSSFGETFDWTNFGTSIGTGITKFFETADFESWGDTIHTWISGILDAGIALLENTDFELIGEKLGDFMESLKVDDILDKVKTLCSTIVSAMASAFTGFQNSTSEKTKLETAIGGLLATLVITKNIPLTLTLSVTIGGIYIGTKLYEILSGNTVDQSFLEELSDICEGLFGENKIDFNIASAIKFVWDDLTGKNSGDNSGITGFSRAGFTTAVTTLLNPYLSGVLVWIDLGEYIQFKWTDLNTSLNTMWTKLKTAISQFWNGGTYSDFGKGANGMPSDVAEQLTYSSGFKQELQEYGGFIVDGIKEGIELSLKTNPFTAPVVKIYELIKEAIINKFRIGSPAKAMYEFGKYIFLGIIEGFIEEMNNYGWDDLAKSLYSLFPTYSTEKTGGTAQGNFSNSHDTIHKNLKLKTTLSGAAQSKKDVDDLTTSFTNLTTEASKNTEAEYKTSVGGQISDIEELNTWKNTIENLYKKWLGRDAKFTSSEDGFESKISGWLEKLDVLGKDWEKKSKNAKFTTSESGLSSFEGNNGYKAKLANIENQWKNDGKSRTATFTTNLAGNLNTSNALSTAASAMATLNSSFQGNKSASFKVSYDGPSAETLGSYAGGVNSINSSFSSASSKDVSYSISASVDMDSVNSAVSKINNAVKKGLTTKFKISDANTATGGIIAHGVKTHIPQYAGGTLDAGSVFIAGEAGPEVMGHINGRTEILNRSQIASIMSNSFVSAMAQFGNRLLTSPESLATKTATYTSYSSRNDNENYALVSEQNELLREQNSLLREIASKDTTISSRDVFNAVRSESNSYYNRTGNSPFLI